MDERIIPLWMIKRSRSIKETDKYSGNENQTHHLNDMQFCEKN